MIRNVIKLAAATLLAALFMVSCENPLYDKVIADVKDPVYYTVTFNTDEGSSVPPQTILAGGVATKPADPTKAENTFMNWYTESACENVYDFSAKVTGNMTLYAGWQYGTDPAPTVEIGGSSSIKITWAPPQNVYYAEIYRYSTETSKYRQIGEVKAADGESFLPNQCIFYDYFADDDYEYCYYVKSANYDSAVSDWVTHITLDSDMIPGRASTGIPTVSDSYSVTYNSIFGYLFFNPSIQWYVDHSQAGTYRTYMSISDGTTVQPIEAKESFSWANLTQLDFGSNFAKPGVPLTVKLESAYVKTDTNTGLKSFTWLNTDGITLTGKTTGIIIPSYKTRSIYFDANGGSGSMSMVFGKVGISYVLPTSTFARSGYQFLGWSKSPTATTADYADEGMFTIEEKDITLYAVWERYTSIHTITFMPNNGIGSMDSISVSQGDIISLPKNLFTRTGYIFRGWALSSTATTIDYADESSCTIGSTGITLYAQWIENATISIEKESYLLCMRIYYDDDEGMTWRWRDEDTLKTTIIGKINGQEPVITWTSSDPTIVEVNNEGCISSVTNGTATITASLANGAKASCTVTVTTESNAPKIKEPVLIEL